MKNNQKKEVIFKLPDEVMKTCGFDAVDALSIKSAEGICVIHPSAMTVLEVAHAIETLSTLAADLTVVLAKAGGICDNCGEHDGASPAERVSKCSLCQDLLDGDGIVIPDHVLEEADIPKNAKLEAYADEESGEITVVESDCQHDLTDLPEGVLEVLIASGVCLAELDERIMLEDIVYGQ